MKSLLTELENNEVVLLMYLSNELPEADRAEVEHLLEGDASLRREFDRLRAEWELIGSALKVDDNARSAARYAVAQRRASQAIKLWSTRRTLDYAAPERRAFRMPWWSYPTAAAALLLITFFVWWSKQGDDLGPIAGSSPIIMTERWNMPIQVEPDGRYATAANAGMDDLSRIERELDAVAELREMVR
jgi:hypothetical protein